MFCKKLTVQNGFNWIQVPDTSFILKYDFEETAFSILVSNVKDLFGEKLEETDIQKRFSECNPHVEMKTKVILKNLKQSLEKILEDNDSSIKVDHSDKCLDIHLEFKVNQVSFFFNLQPMLLPNKEFQKHITIPIFTHALLSQQELSALKKRIHELENNSHSTIVPKKSISDYKMNASAFNLMETDDVSDGVLVKAFLELQNGMKECVEEREKLFDLHRKHVSQSSNQQSSKSTSVSVKREINELLEPSEIKYEEVCNEMDDHLSQQHIKVENNGTESTSEKMKAKKKKSLKF